MFAGGGCLQPGQQAHLACRTGAQGYVVCLASMSSARLDVQAIASNLHTRRLQRQHEPVALTSSWLGAPGSCQGEASCDGLGPSLLDRACRETTDRKPSQACAKKPKARASGMLAQPGNYHRSQGLDPCLASGGERELSHPVWGGPHLLQPRSRNVAEARGCR